MLLGSIALGVVVGRRGGNILKAVSDNTTFTVLSLLFVFGVTIGGNDKLMSEITDLGLSALLIAAGCVAGSVLSAILVTKFFGKADK